MAIVFWTLALLGHGAFWVEIVNRSHGLGWPRKLIDALTAACGVAVIGLPAFAGFHLATNSAPSNAPEWLSAYAWLSIAAFAVIALGRVALTWDPWRDRRSQLTESTTLDLGERLGASATGGTTVERLAGLPGNQLLKVEVEQRRVPLERLPEAFEGLRIAHLTDLHMSGRLSIDYFREMVRVVNDWRPDLVCVTGDIVEHTPQLGWIDSTLGELRPAIGSYFVLGNHDAKIDVNELRRRLTAVGLGNISGRVAAIERGGSRLSLCGDERPWFKAAPPLGGDEEFIVCLAHTPDRFGWAYETGVDLTLAGHCHGGQVCFPVLGALLCPSRHGVRYASGTFRRGRSVMHVGRGTGSLFPLRYNCSPEVALLTLTRGDD